MVEPEEATPFRFMTLDELRAHSPGSGRVVETLIPSRGLVLVSGAVKAGKSMATLDLCVSASYGLPVFSCFAVPTPLKSIYVTEEDSHARVAGHVEAFLRGLDKDPTDPIVRRDFETRRVRLAVRQGFRFDDDRAMQWMRTEALSFKANLLVFDALRRLSQQDLMRDVSQLNAMAVKIRQLAEELACTILVIHHNHATRFAATVDDSAGGFALRAEADTLWNVIGRSDDKRKLEVVSKDLARPHNYRLAWYSEGPEDDPTLLRSSITEIAGKPRTQDDPVLDVFRRVRGPLYIQEVIDKLDQKMSQSTLYTRIRKLMKDGVLERHGKRTKEKGQRYRLVRDDDYPFGEGA